jgi:hypothetical protein
VALTEARITAPNAGVSSPVMTSSAKMAPPIGALNTAARPPAAPQATNVRMWPGEMPSRCPVAEAVAAPICTMGPSCPADPPEPIVIAEAKIFTTATRPGMRPPRVAIAVITSGTP